jgi:hypothetical protein
MSDVTIEAPFGLTAEADHWHGFFVSVDGTEAGTIAEDEVAEVLYQGSSGDTWDGYEAAVIRLKDGRLVAWETWYGPTGSGFSEDAYGGDADVYFGRDLSTLIKAALSDESRRLLGIPEELWRS